MDSKGKRAAGRFSFSKKGSNISLRDPNQDDRSTPNCNRTGCSAKVNSLKGSQSGNQEKMKYPKVPYRSSSGKGIAGSSSRSFSSSDGLRKSHEEQKNQIFIQHTHFEASSSRQMELHDIMYCNRQEFVEDFDSNSRQGENDGSEYVSATSSIQTVQDDSEELESAILQGIATGSMEALDSCTASSSSRPYKQFNRHFGTYKQGTSGSSARSRNTTYVTKPISQCAIAGISAGAPRYGIKGLGCTSISDSVPSSCSSSESSQGSRLNSIRKRHNNGESSSTATRGIESSNRGTSRSLGTGLSGLLSERPFPQQTSRRVRNQPAYIHGAASVRTRWVPSRETQTRLPEQEVDNIVTPSETAVVPRMPHIQFSIPESAPESSSRSFLVELPPVFHDTFGGSTTTNWSGRPRLISRLQDSNTQIFRGPMVGSERYRRFRTEGIQEVLLALERLEQNEDLTYEQLMVLKTNFFFGALNLEDQHRDMRMDIDNMSYEELLALGEKMGTVSTALPEDSFAKCLKRSIYTSTAALPGTSCSGDDEIKCSICQEEYVTGDEMNLLACDHRYHVDCIHQWLRQKNWCPICKASVCPS